MIYRLPTLVLMMIAVPGVAYGVAFGIMAKDEAEWQVMLASQFSDVSKEQRQATTLIRICQDARVRMQIAAACSREDYLGLMRSAAVGAGVSGLGWLGIIAAAGRLARRRRRMLLAVFRPGLYLTGAFLVVLIAVHGILAVTAVYLGEAALIGRIHVGVILAIAGGVLLGVGAVGRATFSVVKTVSMTVVGRRLAPQESPALWALVRDTAEAAGTAPPDHIVAGLEPNFFVTEASVRTLDGELKGRTMFISLPLSRILSRRELQAVIGHELGHYRGQDTEFSRKFYPIYRGTWDALVGLEAGGGEGAGRLALLPATAILAFFFEAFTVAEHEISRERELEADRVGGRIGGASAAASALVKVHAFTGYWDVIRREMARALADGKAYTNVSAFFSRLVADNVRPEALVGLGEQRLAHPTDTHPPLGVRLQSLGVSLAAVEAAALTVPPSEPAAALVTALESIEEELSGVEHYLMAQRLGLMKASREEAPSEQAPG